MQGMAMNGYVTVIGGVNMDITAALTAPFVPADSVPGQVALGCGGVARNIAHNLRLMGHEVRFVSLFGGETFGEMCWRECQAIGLDLALSDRLEGQRNGLYLCVNDQTGDMIAAVADTDIVSHITPEFLESRIQVINASTAVVADTNIPMESLLYLIDHCTGAPLFVDAVSTAKAPRITTALQRSSLKRLHALKLNLKEAQAVTHCDTAIEAAAEGIPVIASDIEGLREAVQDNETGVLIESNPQNLANAIKDLLSMDIHAEESAIKPTQFDTSNPDYIKYQENAGKNTENASKKNPDKSSGKDPEKDSGTISGEDKGKDSKTVSNPETEIFQKIKFRTHGVPGYHIRSVRNQYAKELTDECGFPGLTENRLGVVFLNGEFYTVCDITPSTTADYVCRLFGLNVPDGIEKYSNSDVDVYTRSKIIKLFTADLTQEANQQALEAKVDMDNYLFYFALEVLFNNADWPFNNVTVWRYLGEEDPDNPYTDGRIRFLIEDMDQILSNGLHGDPTRWSAELIDYLMKEKGNTFYHVMQCTRYRDKFLTYVDDLLRTAFEPEHACAVLDRLYAEMKKEYILDYGDAFWKEMEDTAETTKQNVREKEKLYRENITKYMELTDRYSVRIQAEEGVSVTWNNMTVSPGGTWTNDYYCDTAFTVTAHPAEGYRLTGWEVNGKAVEGEGADGSSLTISDALSGKGQAAVTVRVSAQKEDQAEQ